MKLFVDTGKIEEVERALELGVIDGVTTNPSLIAASGRGFRETVTAIAELVPQGDVSAEVVAADYDGMMREALEIASWHPALVIKVPMSAVGLRVVRDLARRGIRTNMTLVFSLPQALLAARAGATYISNFVGRVDDGGGDGMVAVADTVAMIGRYGYGSQVLVASVRHPRHVVEAVRVGAHVATVPLAVLEQLAEHPLTAAGLARFRADWERAGLSIFSPVPSS